MKYETEVLGKLPLTFSDKDLPALEAYNLFMDQYHSLINEELRRDLEDDPQFGPIIKSQSVKEQNEQDNYSRKLEREAILKNKWQAHSDHLLGQGKGYARLGLKFGDWFRAIKAYRDFSIPLVVRDYESDLAKMTLVIDGMNKMVDHGMNIIAESYFEEKNNLIEQEKKRILAAKSDLRKSESRFQALFENSPDHILMVDRNYRILFINHVVSDFKKEEVVGANILDFQSKEGKAIIKKSINYVFRTGKTTIYEIESPLPAGTRYYTSSVAPVFENSKVVSVAVISRDNTERVRAEQRVAKLNLELEQRVEERTARLLATNKDLESFTYTVSHDLRTPIRAIDGFAKILQRRLAGRIDEKEAHYLECVLEGSKKMGILIDDLLAFSRMGRIEKRESRFSLELLFQQVYKDVTNNLDKERIDFSMDPLPEIKGDREMLKLAVANMLGNAVKYSSTRVKSVIMVECKKKTDHFEIIISDNGVGFEMEYHHKVFDIFQRLHTDEEFEGSGVGLAIVKKVINRHGGEVWVSSELEKGTKIYFTIPF